MLASLLLGLTFAYFIWSWMSLESNVRKARALNVHIIRIPFDVNNYAWVTVQPLLWKVLASVPVSWDFYPDFVRFSHRNWHFLEKSSPAARFGSVWATVSPGGIHLYVADPDAIESIFSRWRGFVRPVEMYQMLSVYGPSVFTVKMQDWPRHRRAVAAPFNEPLMEFVWGEALRQAHALLGHWASSSVAGITSMEEDLQTLSLNVLASTAFGESYDFRSSTETHPANSGIESYRDALFLVHKHSILLMLIPYRILIKPMMPKSLAKIGRAAVSLKEYMIKSIEKETAAIDRGDPGSGGFITHLVRTLDDEDDIETRANVGDRTTKKSRKAALSMDEILGNMFVINFAGYDTTANTLAFSVLLLAAHPDIQQWLREEIMAVTHGKPATDWTYDLFPKLKRCEAVFLETLRLYGPITGLPKIAAEKVQHLRVGDRVLAIPPGMETIPLPLAVQTDPRYWEDPFTWQPSRWLVALPGAGTEANAREELFVPRKGSYFPWSEGLQGCAGQKFSRVEAVAALACIFQAHRLYPKTDMHETSEQARKRARDCVNNVNYQLLLKMNNSKEIKLGCTRL
ncbi:putative cytochrome P450 [Cryphonectria parasitica EP155]|uniref:Cytochrome P450 n=1 Tax=Cryphonectria parasitica (strain ATCC 38755 / EP155) TaxID=660469 RepID=A0A9P5CJY6_CRYP1|nr:putative cytochrome P450 [Cryphonectria parasitica EP155]KAF3760401.1 putative cytochrome P450 [Cryphonectria parasitica EP155]